MPSWMAEEEDRVDFRSFYPLRQTLDIDNRYKWCCGSNSYRIIRSKTNLVHQVLVLPCCHFMHRWDCHLERPCMHGPEPRHKRVHALIFFADDLNVCILHQSRYMAWDNDVAHLSIYLSLYLSIYLSLYLSIYLSLYLSIYLSTYD